MKAVGYFRQAIATGSHLRARLFGVVGHLPAYRSTRAWPRPASACRRRRRRRERRWPWTRRWPRPTRRWPGSSIVTTGTGRARRRSSGVSLELDPNSAEASPGVRHLSGDDAPAARKASPRSGVPAELSPLSVRINAQLGGAMARLGRYEEAIDQLRKAQEIDAELRARRTSRWGSCTCARATRPRRSPRSRTAAALSSPGRQRWLGYRVWRRRADGRGAEDTGASSRALSREAIRHPPQLRDRAPGARRQGAGLGRPGSAPTRSGHGDPRPFGGAVRPAA